MPSTSTISRSHISPLHALGLRCAAGDLCCLEMLGRIIHLLTICVVTVTSCYGGAVEPDEGQVTVQGTVTHLATEEPLDGVVIDALTSASPSRRRLITSSTSDAEGRYGLALEPRTYVIQPDVADGMDCHGDLREIELDVENYDDLIELDFAFVPPPCD